MWSSEAPETETVQAGENAPEPTGTGWLRSLIGWSCSVEVGLTHREGPETEAVQAGEIALELTGTGGGSERNCLQSGSNLGPRGEGGN